MLLLMFFLQISNLDVSTQSISSAGDNCGVIALYYYAKLNGSTIKYEDLLDKLPPPSKLGYSMEQLIELGGSVGIQLEGIKLPVKKNIIDSTFIVLFADEHAGHFATIRPVGSDGSYSQIFDSQGPPQIVLTEDLVLYKGWTGYALSRKNPYDIQLRIAIIIIISSVLVFLMVSLSKAIGKFRVQT